MNKKNYVAGSVIITFLFVLLPLKVFGENITKKETYAEPNSMNIERAVIQHITTASNLFEDIFCVEVGSDKEFLLREKFAIKMDPSNMNSFIEGLERIGFTTQKYKSSVILSSVESVGVADNPLNQTVKNFEFYGNHEAFIEKIRPLFPDVGPSISKLTGQYDSNTMYSIQSASEISIRDLLMIYAEKSGVAWKAVIKPKAPTFLIEDPETKRVQEFHTSAVTLSFQQIRRAQTQK